MGDVKLLPLPEIERWYLTGDYSFQTNSNPEGGAVDYDAHVAAMWQYARACVEANTEALRKEVERLTFEMGCLQQQYDERTAYAIVHRGAALACSDAVRSAYSDEYHRAERLAEALRRCANWGGLGKGWDSQTALDLMAWIDDGMTGDLPPLPGYLNPATAQEGDHG